MKALIMANLKILSFISLALIFLSSSFQCVSAFDYEEYFEKSIFNDLKNKNGSFTSHVSMQTRRGVREFDETFSFAENAGEYVEKVENSTGHEPLKKTTCMNDISEMYVIDHTKNKCQYWQRVKGSVAKILSTWAPRKTFIDPENADSLGTN